MYAVIETGGKQYRVEVGTELAVELLDVEAGEEITLDRVLLVADGDEAAIGRPVVDGAVVSATVLRNDRAAKVISFKYKPKARRRVKKGHRQEQTVLRITDVTLNGRSAAEEARRAAEAKRTERQRLEEAAAALRPSSTMSEIRRTVRSWRWPFFTRRRALGRYLKLITFSPRSWRRTSAETVAFSTTGRPIAAVSPSATRRTRSRVTSLPGWASSSSTSSSVPTSTRYCFPPVSMTAYMDPRRWCGGRAVDDRGP